MAEVVGEVEVRLRADIAKLEADLRRAETATKTAGAKMSRSFDKMTKSVLKYAAAAVSIAAVSKVLGSMVKNAADEEAANKRLAAAMVSAGIHSDELAQSLSQQAKAYDLLSVASETELTHAQAFLLNMGVTTKKMDVALRASTNLAAAMGWDLTAAVRNVGKTMGGFAGELSETIPELKAMSRETLMAGGALDLIAEKYSGQAVEQLSTYQGRIGELSDSWEVFSAKVGTSLTKNDEMLDSLAAIDKMLRDPSLARGAAALAENVVGSFVWMGEAIERVSRGLVILSGHFRGAVGDNSYAAKWMDAVGLTEDEARGFRNLGRSPVDAPGIGPVNLPAPPPEAGRIKPLPTGPILTEQQIKSQRDFLDKLLTDQATYNEDYEALNEIRVGREFAAMKKLKLGESDLALARELIKENSTSRLTDKEEELAEAAQDLRDTSRDNYLNATGQEILAIEERLDREIEAFEEMEEKGGSWSQQKIESAAIAAAEIKEIQDEELEDWNNLFESMEDGFTDAMATFLITGEMTFKQLAMSFVREFIQQGLKKNLGTIFGSIGDATGIIGGLAGGISDFSGGVHAYFDPIGPRRPDGSFAHGGRIGAGQMGLVGEYGPELYVPDRSGTIVTNSNLSAMARGKGDNNVIVNVVNTTGEKSSTTESEKADGTKQIEILIGDTVARDINRGGSIDASIRGAYGLKRPGVHGM